MMLDRLRKTTALGAMAVLASGGAALAQQPPRPADPAQQSAEGPQRTVANFGDWAVVCILRQAQGATPAGRLCEMVQTVQDQRQQPLSLVALGRLGPAQPLRLVLRVPVNVLVGSPARLTLGGDGAAPTALPFRHCQPRGCFAELELRDEALLGRLRNRAADRNGRLAWQDASGNETGVPVSFRGFSAAFEAMLRETS